MHGNSNDNDLPHHLYGLVDRVNDAGLKCGISSEVIDEDGTSSRMRVQLNSLNHGAGWLKYFGKIILRGNAGKKQTRQSSR